MKSISDMSLKKEMSKSEMLESTVNAMKELPKEKLMAAYEKMYEMGHDDKDGDEKDEQVESLSRNTIIKTVVEFCKDKSRRDYIIL